MFAANGFALTIATFGALATGCRKRADGMRLLLDMKVFIHIRLYLHTIFVVSRVFLYYVHDVL